MTVKEFAREDGAVCVAVIIICALLIYFVSDNARFQKSERKKNAVIIFNAWCKKDGNANKLTQEEWELLEEHERKKNSNGCFISVLKEFVEVKDGV